MRCIKLWLKAAAICAIWLACVGVRAEQPLESDSQGDTATPVLPETEVEAVQASEPPVEQALPSGLEGSMFASPVESGYLAPSSTTGTLIDLPNAEIPATVNVVPRAAINEQLALEIEDVVRNAGGTTLAGDSFFADRIFLRGLELGSRDFRKDGFLDPTFVPRDFQNIERIEILKGPSSVLYGAGSPAGVVNLITKKPIPARFADLNYTFGGFGQSRFTVDVNGMANSAGTVNYRVNLAQEDTDGFRDFGFISRALVAPAVSWQMDSATRLTWLGEWHKDHRRGDQGMPAIGGDALALPPERYVGEPANDFIHFEEFRQTLLLTHEFSDYAAFQIGGSSLFYEFPGSVTVASGNPAPGFFPDVAPPLFYRSRTDIVLEDEQSQSVIANLAGEIFTGGLLHKAVVGLEYVYFDSKSLFQFGAVNPIDVTNPVYFNPPSIPLGSMDFPAFRQQRVGGYLQDFIEVTPKLKLVGGVRFDTVDFDFDRTLTFGFPVHIDTDQEFNRASPRGGIVYLPFGNDELAFYYQYGTSFSPPGGGIFINTGGLKPILGEIHELGVKTQLLENLTLDVAGFHTTRQNADLNTSSFFLVQVGEERAQGAELNLIGDLTPRWSWIANYTYADVRLIDSQNPLLDGNRQRNLPFNSANFWTRDNVIQDPKHRLGGALGLVYLGDRPGDLTNSFDLPGFSRWDAGLLYDRGMLHAALYVENVFDIAYAASSINEFQVFPGAPVNARAQIGIVY